MSKTTNKFAPELHHLLPGHFQTWSEQSPRALDQANPSTLTKRAELQVSRMPFNP
jgi:hypothetical protein